MIHLIESAIRIIQDGLEKSNRPVILCSFGKDSLTVLHLLRHYTSVPVILWKENSQFKKYEFANNLINDWDLEVYDYPPCVNDILYHNNKIDGIGMYQLGNRFIYKAIEIHESANGCILEDIMQRPTCDNYSFKWDCVFMGSKKSDIDPLLGKVELKKPTIDYGNIKVVYPLYEWTDNDVWEYIHKNNIPYNTKRYNAAGKEYQEKRYNENYHYACTKCVNPSADDMIFCHKEDKTVENVGKKIDYDNKFNMYTNKIKVYVNMEDTHATTLS